MTTSVKGNFQLRGTEFVVEIEASHEDVNLLGEEIALRKAFLLEANRRLGGVCLNDWKFLGRTTSEKGSTS